MCAVVTSSVWRNLWLAMSRTGKIYGPRAEYDGEQDGAEGED